MEQTTSFLEVEESYLDCRKRKRKTKGSLEYELFETENNYKLCNELCNRTYKIEPSDAFIVSKPVCREVFAGQFRDRIVHHLIIRRKEPFFESEFIQDTYSCRKDKGTLYGVKRMYEQYKVATNNFTKRVWIVEGDFKSFFMLINKGILFEKLQPAITNDWERWIIHKMVYNRPQDYCIRKQPICAWDPLPDHKSLFFNDGIPIGNLTSQIFANYYVSDFDKWVLNKWHPLGYGRYVDDFRVIFGTHEECLLFIEDARIKLLEIDVILHPNKIRIISSERGFNFIGAIIKPHRIYTSNRTICQFSESIYKFLPKCCPENLQNFVASTNSYLGYLSQYSTYRIRFNILFSKIFEPWLQYCYFDENLTKIVPYRNYQQYTDCRSSKRSFTDDLLKQTHYFIKSQIIQNVLGNGTHQKPII